MRDHPQRPPKPGLAIPLRGDDQTAWLAWRDQCQACSHAIGEHDCDRGGVIGFLSGRKESLLKQAPGGCSDWHPKEAPRG